MTRGLIAFALLVTGALTLILGQTPGTREALPELPPLVVSRAEAETTVETDTLGRGQTLAGVLSRQGFSGAEVAAVTAALRPQVDLRRLRRGVTVSVARTAWDSVERLAIRVDPDHMVQMRPGDEGWRVEVADVPIQIDTIVLAGRIENTLYASVMALPGVAMSTEERVEQVMWGIYRPFQWSIDFGLDLREGDAYKAVYEREVRPDGSVRDARVLAAEFRNAGETHRAYWFGPRHEYFDDDGQSMERVFLKAPVDFRRISSRFTRRRYHPILHRWRAHLGTDYVANRGTPAYTTADGTVTRAGWWDGYGRIVEVRHVNGYRTRYAHLSRIAKGIRPGVRVRQGQTIGYVGSSGLATAPHLHYELRHNGRAVDPRKVDLPSGQPVATSRMGEFQGVRTRLRALLDRAEPGRASVIAE